MTLGCRSCREVILRPIEDSLSHSVLLSLVPTRAVFVHQAASIQQRARIMIHNWILLLETAILIVCIHGLDSAPARLRPEKFLLVLTQLFLHSVLPDLRDLRIKHHLA